MRNFLFSYLVFNFIISPKLCFEALGTHYKAFSIVGSVHQAKWSVIVELTKAYGCSTFHLA